jgi:hypothetical protein
MAGATNTIIQILRSDVTAYPTTLNPGEQAYSYVSDKLFVGNTDNSVVTIGGKYYVDLIDNATASNTGNTIVRRNSAGNAAFVMLTVADDASNATDVVNKSYLDSRIGSISSNTIYDGTIGVDGYSNVHVDSTVGGGQVTIVANNTTVATFTKNTATFAQDIGITGNLTVLGAMSYTNVQTLLVSNNEIVLNANATGSPLINAYITVNRGAADNAAIIWDEPTDQWQIDHGDGVVHDIVHTGGDQSIANTTTLSFGSVTNGLHAGALEVSGHTNVSSLTANSTIITNQLIVASNVQLANVANVAYYGNVVDAVTPLAGKHYIMLSDGNSGNNRFQANSLIAFDTSNTTLAVGYSAYTPLPNTLYQATGSSKHYIQNNIQNINNEGSADWVATADNGSDSTGFINMGMAGGNYNYDGFHKPNDGYLLVTGQTGQGFGNLWIGTATADTSSANIGSVYFHIGAVESANIVGYITRENDTLTGNTTWALGKSTGANAAYILDVAGKANVAALYINNTKVLDQSFGLPVGFGGTGRTSVTANTVLYGNGSGQLLESNAPTAGDVLQFTPTGVRFGGLDGGTF